MTHLGTALLRVDIRYNGSIAGPDCKDYCPGVVYPLVGPQCEDFIDGRDVADVAKLDVLDLLLLDQAIAKAIPVDDALAVFLKQGARRGEVVFPITLVNNDFGVCPIAC